MTPLPIKLRLDYPVERLALDALDDKSQLARTIIATLRSKAPTASLEAQVGSHTVPLDELLVRAREDPSEDVQNAASDGKVAAHLGTTQREASALWGRLQLYMWSETPQARIAYVMARRAMIDLATHDGQRAERGIEKGLSLTRPLRDALNHEEFLAAPSYHKARRILISAQRLEEQSRSLPSRNSPLSLSVRDFALAANDTLSLLGQEYRNAYVRVFG